MKIAFVHQPIFYVPINTTISIPLLTHEVARRLVNKSIDVIVYASGGDFQKKVEYKDDVQYQGMPIGIDKSLLKFLKLGRRVPGLNNVKRPPFGSKFYYLGYILQVAYDLKKQQCDIVHIHNLSQFIPVIRALNPTIKIVLHMHIDWLTLIDRKLIEQRLSQVDLIIGCSNYMTESIRRRFPQVAARCQTVHNGVDVNTSVSNLNYRDTKKNGRHRAIFVGRVSPEKGVHVLLDAFEKVIKDYPQAELEIVGKEAILPLSELVAMSDNPNVKDLASFYQGSYLSHLRDKLSSSAAAQVSFTGNIPHGQLLNHLQDADVFIQPSVFDDPFPLAVLEAMAAGLPVIATRTGGLPESVEDGKTGILVDRSDAVGLTEAILRLLSNDELRKSMGEAGRQRAIELFSWERMVENLLCQYNKLCESNQQILR